MERRSRTVGSPPGPVLVGLLCTYCRPHAARRFVEALERQTRAPDVLVVVDNGGDDELSAWLAHRTGPMELRYLRPESNIGPAGAFDLGLRSVAGELDSDDVIVHLDDDDPPVDPEQLALLVAELHEAARRDPRIAGIGLSGGRLHTRTGTVAGVAGTPRLEPVDHLHGGYLPVYRAQALIDVGGNDPTFFYGFEELELGRRLHEHGWKLLVHNDLMGQVRDRYPKRGHAGRRHLAIDANDLGWSRFHKERNLIRVLRRERYWVAILMTVLVRHLAKPLLALPLQPTAAVARLRLGARATIAGLRQAGGIDSRYLPEGTSRG